MHKTVIVLILSSLSVSAAQPTEPARTLLAADALANLYNWSAAAPLYAEAERSFTRQHDRLNALRAHIGCLRATMESRSLSQLSGELAGIADQPDVKNNTGLLLRCFIAKGDADAEIDSALAQTDWETVLKLARRSHDIKWQARATGEIGFHRYVQGDHVGAKKDTAMALIAARRTKDFAADIRFSSGIGTGLALGGSVDEGLKYLNDSLTFANQHPETGYPYMAVAGKIMALIQKGELDEAAPLITDQLHHASADHRMVKFTQARLFLSDVAVARHDQDDAIRILTATIPIAKRNRTRLLTEIYSKLSNLQRARGNLQLAAQEANSAIAAAGENKDMYLAPELLLTLARLKIALHREDEAELIFERATDVVEGMLAHTTEIRTREALLTTMSYVYAGARQVFCVNGHSFSNLASLVD